MSFPEHTSEHRINKLKSLYKSSITKISPQPEWAASLSRLIESVIHKKVNIVNDMYNHPDNEIGYYSTIYNNKEKIATFTWNIIPKQKLGTIDLININRKYQGLRLGTHIFTAIKNEFKLNNLQTIRLEHVRNDAVPFWEKQGFIPKGDPEVWTKNINTNYTSLYRGDKTPIPLKDIDTISVFNRTTTESLMAFTSTPGLYFTTSKENASHYGKYITTVKIKHKAHILDMKKPIGKALVTKILSQNHNLSIAIADWSENKNEGYRMLIDVIMEETDPLERLKAIWSDSQFSDFDFVNAMIKNKIDGIKVYKEGYEHYVIYNKDILVEV